MAKVLSELEKKEDRSRNSYRCCTHYRRQRTSIRRHCTRKDRKRKIRSTRFRVRSIFIPEGYTESFAEMDNAKKNSMSHRGRAIAKLVEFLI